ncbi:protein TolQ [Nevskia ramosa]|uniref:protein TolQ n=1 Tax=Nevskia ramosa TaxID=64002 RepID=UPI0003B35445|nr:protein TolQ [Nevskia ramosa]
MSGTFSLTQLVLEATIPVKLVMGVLIAASLASWAVILAKRGLLSRIENQAVAFETRFWSGGSMDDLYESHRRGGAPEEGLPLIFRAGYEEFKRQQVANIPPDDALAAVQRQMRVVMARETEKLEGGLSLLATIGSTSPYVGLLGTVWGIVNAFVSIGNVKQATLASVAPGIAEALIATAIGLFAAIPAVVAYNFFVARVDRLENRFSTFAEELTGIVDRGLRGGSRAG